MKPYLLTSFSRNRVYAEALFGSVPPEKFIAQPVAGITMNHPAWILSHLNVYWPVATALLTRQPVEDPSDHKFGPKSVCVNDASAYDAPDTLVANFFRLRDETHTALEHCDDAVFAEPVPVERWRTKAPTVGDMIVTLIIKHECTHLGQLSAWRRAMGMGQVTLG